MKNITTGLLLAGLLAGATSDATPATGSLLFANERPTHLRFPSRERSFQRVGTFGNYLNNGADAADETVSEIIAATADGNTLVYTDGVRGTIGFIDITDPGNPQPLGTVILDPDPSDDTDYSPTSVEVLGNRYALVGANTSESLTNTSGKLVVVDIVTHGIVTEIDLGGQPDSVKISPDRKYVAIVIENERNENLCVGGSETGREVVDDEDHLPGVNTTEDLCEDGGGVIGGLPQTPFGNPAGYLAVVKIDGQPTLWSSQKVDLTGLSAYAPEDPEPEFVDINHRNEAVVTLQENNHLAIVDLPSLTVKRHFGMGTVTLNGIDLTEDGVISLTETQADVPREPDAVAWVPGRFGKRHNIATANEGDLFGGSRGFSIFRRNGTVAFDSGTSLEEFAVQHGHYPEGRSDAKGTEPEAMEYGRFGQDDYVFVGTERGNFIAVYKLNHFGRPNFEQLLPGPLGPEGLLAIPHRNLVIASGETDLEGFGVRSTVMIYELKRGKPAYPQILSDDNQSSPIPWSALSRMVAIPWRHDSLLAVWDGFYSQQQHIPHRRLGTAGGDHRRADDPGRQRQLRSRGHCHRARSNPVDRERGQRRRQHPEPPAAGRSQR